MIKIYFKKINAEIISYLSVLVLIFILYYCSFNSPVWDYDAYGSVISHLELDDNRFIDIYFSYLNGMGFNNYFSNFLINFILPFIIVPVRWTYAIGISPIYGLSRLVDLDWGVLRLILLSFHFFISAYGLHLINKSIRFFYKSSYIVVILLGLLFLSPSFIYWNISLSPYSFHIIALGLILFYEKDNKFSDKIFGPKSIYRSVIQMLNYQYITVVAFIGIFDFLSNPKTFFNKNYKSWVLPFVISISSFTFLYFRSLISGKHSTPNLSILTDTGIDKYNLIENYENFFQSINFFFSRFYDLSKYFFQQTDYSYLLSNFYSNNHVYETIIIAIILSIGLCILFSKKNRLIRLCLIIIFSSITFYLLNIYPFMPSRHSLVIFLPMALLFSIVIIEIISALPIKLDKIISCLFLIFSIFTLFSNFNTKESPLNVNYLASNLENNNVNRLILSPCSQEPLLNYHKIKLYKPLYQCGPNIIEKENFNNTIFAVYSINDISVEKAISYILPFSENNLDIEKFKFIDKFSQNNKKKHFLSIIHYLE